MNNSFKWLAQFLIFTVAALALAETVSLPFWKSKPEVYKRIKEDRAIIVSAKSEKDEKGEKAMILLTAGRIKAPLYFTHEIATQYGQYQKILPYVSETTYDKESGNLFASGAFMGLKAKMTMKLSAEEGEGSKDYIKWEIISGFLTGMKGVITEEKISDEVTEISMDAKYVGPTVLPGFLMNWGLEFIGQKMASAMRSHVEAEWEKEK